MLHSLQAILSAAGAKAAVIDRATAVLKAALPTIVLSSVGPLGSLLAKNWWILRLVGLNASRFLTVASMLAWLAPFGIGVAGFGAAGVAHGSLAAWVQMARYGGVVPAGSIFATLQSCGAGGMIGTTAIAAFQFVSGGAAVVGGALTALFKFA